MVKMGKETNGTNAHLNLKNLKIELCRKYSTEEESPERDPSPLAVST